jgi:hypothetical protein
MAKKNVHVTLHSDMWAVMREGNNRASSLHDTQKQAGKKGTETARRAKSRSSSCTTGRARFASATATAATPFLLEVRGCNQPRRLE